MNLEKHKREDHKIENRKPGRPKKYDIPTSEVRDDFSDKEEYWHVQVSFIVESKIGTLWRDFYAYNRAAELEYLAAESSITDTDREHKADCHVAQGQISLDEESNQFIAKVTIKLRSCILLWIVLTA